jgi:hypothetical protein
VSTSNCKKAAAAVPSDDFRRDRHPVSTRLIARPAKKAAWNTPESNAGNRFSATTHHAPKRYPRRQRSSRTAHKPSTTIRRYAPEFGTESPAHRRVRRPPAQRIKDPLSALGFMVQKRGGLGSTVARAPRILERSTSGTVYVRQANPLCRHSRHAAHTENQLSSRVQFPVQGAGSWHPAPVTAGPGLLGD